MSPLHGDMSSKAPLNNLAEQLQSFGFKQHLPIAITTRNSTNKPHTTTSQTSSTSSTKQDDDDDHHHEGVSTCSPGDGVVLVGFRKGAGLSSRGHSGGMASSVPWYEGTVLV